MKRGLKLDLFLAVVLISLWCVASVSATDYYVNASKSCAGDGTSEANAWCSVANVSGASFSLGDNIYFARGETWREQLTVPSSGSSGSPITFGAYGSGEKPIIEGADLATTWEDAGKANLYNKTFTYTPMLALEDGLRLTEIAWDTDIDTTYPSMSAGTYTIDTSNKIVYMWCSDNADPDTHIIEVAARGSNSWGVKMENVSYITIDGLTINNAGYDAIKVDATAGVDVSNIIIQNCTVYNAGFSGISITNSGNKDAAHPVTNITVDSNTVSYTKKHAIIFWYDVSDSNISRNLVHHTAQSVSAGFHGISSWSDDADSYPNGNIIEYNEVYSVNKLAASEGTGIQLDANTYSTSVRYNKVHDNEGPGIRLYSTANTDENNSIYGNIAYGNAEEGIGVLHTQGTDIYNNVCYDNDIGIKLGGNQAADTNVKNNICFENIGSEIYVEDNAHDGLISDYNLGYHSAGGTFMHWRGINYNWVDWQLNSGNDSNSVESDPFLTDPASDDFTLQATSPAIDVGVNLGASYDNGLDSDSVWPNSVLTLDQDDYGSGWEIGAYVYEDTVNPTISFSCSPTSVTAGETITCSCSATDDVDSSPDVSYTANPSTSNTGTLTTTCTATDNSGNSASSSISYTVSSIGGRTPTTTWTTHSITEDLFEQGYTRELGVRSRIKVQMGGEDHFIGVVSISESQATIEISSDPVQVILDAGEDAKVDVTDDGFYDVYVLLNGITNNKADVTIQKIHEEVPEGGTGVETTGEQPLEEEKSKLWIWLVLALIVVVIIIIIIVIYKHKRRGFEKISEITNE